MKDSMLLPLALGLTMACAGGGGGNYDAFDYEAPSWAVEVVNRSVDGRTTPVEIIPTNTEALAEVNRVTQCWLDYAERTGNFRPPGMPRSGTTQYAGFEITPSCNTSGDWKIDHWYFGIKSYSCTSEFYYHHDTLVRLIGHAISHNISGCGSGNFCHSLFESECGV